MSRDRAAFGLWSAAFLTAIIGATLANVPRDVAFILAVLTCMVGSTLYIGHRLREIETIEQLRFMQSLSAAYARKEQNTSRG